MKILLINPPYLHIGKYDSRALSMSLIYLASVIKARGHEVKIYNAALGSITQEGSLYRYGASLQETKEFLQDQAFDLAGISCSFSSQWPFVGALAAQIKNISKEIPIVVGGLFPTYAWKDCLAQNHDIDAILIGEAELTFAQLIGSLDKGKLFPEACQSIDGIAFKDAQGHLRHNPKTTYNENLDDLPFPDWHMIDLETQFSMQKKLMNLPARSLPILSSRSCPNRCSFCNMYLTHGSRWRARSPENVVNEIEYLIHEFNVNNFYFIDDNFSCDKERAKQICRLLIQRKLRIQYTFPNGISVKTLDHDLVQLMKASGCIGVCVAAESGSERIRNEIYKKNLKLEDILKACKLFRQFKIPTITFFMVGAPTETHEDILASRNLIARLPTDLVTVSVFTPYPGTALYDQCRENGWLAERSLFGANKIDGYSTLVQMPGMTPADIERWKMELLATFLATHLFSVIKNIFSPLSFFNFENMIRAVFVIKHYLKITCSSPIGKSSVEKTSS